MKKAMNCKQVLDVLRHLKPELVRRFGVTRLALFGSTVRNEARVDSDIDIVVAFDGPATSTKYFGVQFLLEDELGGCPRIEVVARESCFESGFSIF